MRQRPRRWPRPRSLRPAPARPLGCCSAGPGFDEATGWGSVNLSGLDQVAIQALPKYGLAEAFAVALDARGQVAKVTAGRAMRVLG